MTFPWGCQASLTQSPAGLPPMHSSMVTPGDQWEQAAGRRWTAVCVPASCHGASFGNWIRSSLQSSVEWANHTHYYSDLFEPLALYLGFLQLSNKLSRLQISLLTECYRTNEPKDTKLALELLGQAIGTCTTSVNQFQYTCNIYLLSWKGQSHSFSELFNLGP